MDIFSTLAGVGIGEIFGSAYQRGTLHSASTQAAARQFDEMIQNAKLSQLRDLADRDAARNGNRQTCANPNYRDDGVIDVEFREICDELKLIDE